MGHEPEPPTIQAGMVVLDAVGDYVGVVSRVYTVPAKFAAPDGRFGCCKVRRSRFPFGGPPPLLVPFDAITATDHIRAALAVTCAAVEQWAQGSTAS